MNAIDLANHNQRRATDVGHSVWVGASAGSGKTTVLTNRVLALLLAGVPPHRILCITFTKAAAAEMTARIAARLADWVTLDDAALDAEILRLHGKVPDDAERARARTLFATLIDGEGTVQIQTIHAFCQTVLGRFPLEAGIAPNFEVMDERTAREMLSDAHRAVLAAAERDPRLGEALQTIAIRLDEERFTGVLAQFAGERGRLTRAVTAYGGVDGLVDALAAAMGVDSGGEAVILAEACTDDACAVADLRHAMAGLLGGSKTDIARGEGMAAWLSAEPAARVGGFQAYLRLFTTGDGEPTKVLATKALAHHRPVLEAEQARVMDVAARCRAARLVTLNGALIRLADAVLRRYEAQKAAHGRLDYDDLILATRRLLEDTAPGWVHFKLDGGIDHVLVDEAQDTNPDQWAVIAALVGEFFSGEGIERKIPRTLFVVGDRKQSIYGFQRAAPEQFETMRQRFATQAREGHWQTVSLDVSFRTVPRLLEITDTVFAGIARAGVVEAEEELRHIASRDGHAGRLEVWPLTPGEASEAEDPWQPATDYARARSGEALLAERIATTIRGWLDRKETLPSTGTPIRAGDVMILLRSRGRLMGELVRALKRARVPVAGVDRMQLENELAVQDLVALGRFLLLPDDDLTLAAVLKSPLVGLDEDQLLALAQGRDRGESLWRRLGTASGEAERAAHALLADMMARADFVTPHAFYADLLGRGQGRARLVARLGAQANDTIDEFLAATLVHARTEPPSMQGFLHWLGAGAGELKRDLEQADRDEVRIITVHGAKGLEAPIVFLPDAAWTANNPRPPLFWIAHQGLELPLWSPGKAYDAPLAAAARTAWQAREQEEHHRLLYVALTRARDRLIVCGAGNPEKPPERSWYPRVAEAIAAEGVRDADGVLVLEAPQVAPPKPVVRPARLAAEAPPLPGWCARPAPDELGALRVAPSQAGADEGVPVVSPLAGGGTDRFRRGLLIHALLQHLPQRPSPERPEAGRRWLGRQGIAAGAAEALLGECLAILDHPTFAPIFGPGSRAEVPVAGLLDGRRVNGQIDRLLVTPEAVWIIDYKSLRPPPHRAEDVPLVYLRQMAAYRSLLAAIHPGRPVHCALLWTETPRLMVLPNAVLDRGLQAGGASPLP